MIKICFITIFFGINVSIFSQPIAFPGAEGAGKYTTGGRGGKVIFVTNLDDDGNGSLRKAIKDSFSRIIIFKVSGTIFLQKPLEIKHGNVTIAGQTAPGDGICVAGHSVSIKANNVIVRYMRFRLGDLNKEQGDAFGGIGRKNLMIDHCSMSWATDECASFYNNQNTTMQWCIISESLNNSVHKKGEHGYGGIWGGSNISFHHNLLAHNNSRNPRFNGTRGRQILTDQVDFRNNVVYNWGMNSTYGGENGKYNMVANYYKPGPATPQRRIRRIVEITTSKGYDYGLFYVSDNYVDGSPAVSADNWNGGIDTEADVSKVKATSPFPFEAIEQQKAEDAYNSVLAVAGASLVRDSVDMRVIKDVKDGTSKFGATFEGGGKGIIDSQTDVGGWPALKTLPAPVDTDIDGMPDEWEIANKLNPNNPADANLFTNDKEYTNIEVYLNSIVPEYKK